MGDRFCPSILHVPRCCILTTACATLALAACGKSPDPDAAAPVAAATPADEAAANAAAQADADRAAEMAAREQSLSEREAAVKVQELEAELARRDAESAATFAAEQNAKAAAATAAAKKAKAKAATATATATPKTPIPAAPIIVPAGTSLAVALNSDVTTKTASVGDPVHGTLKSDVMIGDRRAASAGAPISGTVTQVISGSNKIGGTPTLGIEFTSLIAVDGTTVPIGAQLVQVGKSETGKDTAKIVGGAAAGAIIGHQVNSKNGSVVGGILGGAAGTAAAKKTGGEVLLAAGTVVSVSTSSPFQVDR